MDLTERAKGIRIISIKDDAPAIHCVESGFLENPQDLISFVRKLANERKIKSIQKKNLVVEYTFNLENDNEYLPIETSNRINLSKEEPPENLIKIAITEYGIDLLKIGLSCNGSRVKPRRDIENIIKTLETSGKVLRKKTKLIEEEKKDDGIYLTTFNYLPNFGNEKEIKQISDGQQKKINSLEEQVGFSANLIFTLLSENPELLKKPEVIKYLKEEGIPTTLFSKASDYKERNIYLRELYEVIENDIGVTKKDIESDKKIHEIAFSRHIMMYLLIRQFNENKKIGSFSKIGTCMGGKNHATVLLACKKFQKNGGSFPFELTGDIKTDYENAKSLYLHLNSKKPYNIRA
jgi:hypothetical protein